MKKYIRCILIVLLVSSFSFSASKAFSQKSEHPTSTYVKGITAGRARALVGVIIGLISLIIGVRIKNYYRRTPAIISIFLGFTAIILGVIHLSISAGAVFGSGSGKAGAIGSLVLGLLGITFSGLSIRKKNA